LAILLSFSVWVTPFTITVALAAPVHVFATALTDVPVPLAPEPLVNVVLQKLIATVPLPVALIPLLASLNTKSPVAVLKRKNLRVVLS
jgi:hypothetical protein